MSKVLISSFLIISAAFELRAQSAGSPYSIFGIGDLNRYGSGIFSQFSSTGYGINRSGYYNNLNPAANINKGVLTSFFNLGFSVSRFKLETASESQSFSRSDFNEVSLMFKLNPRSSLFFGFEPFTSVNYNLDRENFTLSNNQTIDVQYRGDGGTSTVYLGTNYSVSNSLSFGVRANLYTGSINKFEEGIVDQTGTFIQSQDDVSLNAFDFTLGFLNTTKLGSNQLSLGGVYSTGADFNATTSFEIIQDQFLVFESENEEPDDIYVVPQKLGLGASFQTKSILYAIDYSYETWSDGDLDSQDSEFDDVQRVSLGFEYKNGGDNLKKYMQYLSFRAGVFVQNSYLQIENTSFTEYGYSFGISLPFKGGHEINLGYQWQRSGSLDNDLIREVQQNYNFNITFRDFWFQQRKIN